MRNQRVLFTAALLLMFGCAGPKSGLPPDVERTCGNMPLVAVLSNAKATYDLSTTGLKEAEDCAEAHAKARLDNKDKFATDFKGCLSRKKTIGESERNKIIELTQQYVLAGTDEVRNCIWNQCYAKQLGVKIPDCGASTKKRPSGSRHEETFFRCSELDRCEGEIDACVLAGDDGDPTGNLLVENTQERPLVFGEWRNEECDTKGRGWHAYVGSCGRGTGTRFKRCKFVYSKPTEANKPINKHEFRRCSELENCEGQVDACVLAGDDSDPGGNHLVENTRARPIQFGEWSNEECGTTGRGWHVAFGSCGKGTGTRFKRCKFVYVKP